MVKVSLMWRVLVIPIVVFLVAITTARVVGSRDRLAPVQLTHVTDAFSARVYVDVVRDRRHYDVWQSREPQVYDPVKRLEMVSADEQTRFELTYVDSERYRPYYALRVIGDGVVNTPIERPVHFDDRYVSGDDRYWYFLTNEPGSYRGTLVQLDIQSGTVREIVRNVDRLGACSGNGWCTVRVDRAGGTTIPSGMVVVNLAEGSAQQVDAVPDHYSSNAVWLDGGGVFLYAAAVNETILQLVAYDPVTENREILRELDGAQTLTMHEQDNGWVVVTKQSSNATDDLLVVRGDDPVEVAVSVRALLPELKLADLRFRWSSQGERLLFAASDMQAGDFLANLYVLSVMDGSVVQLTDYDDIHRYDFDLSDDGMWVSYLTHHTGGGRDYVYVMRSDGATSPRALRSLPVDGYMSFQGWR